MKICSLSTETLKCALYQLCYGCAATGHLVKNSLGDNNHGMKFDRKENAHLVRNRDGHTAIMVAAKDGSFQAFKVLWNHLANHQVNED